MTNVYRWISTKPEAVWLWNLQGTLSPSKESLVIRFSICMTLPLMQLFLSRALKIFNTSKSKLELLKFHSIFKPNKWIAASKSNEEQTNCVTIQWKEKLTLMMIKLKLKLKLKLKDKTNFATQEHNNNNDGNGLSNDWLSFLMVNKEHVQ